MRALEIATATEREEQQRQLRRMEERLLALEQENCALRRTSSQMVSDTQTTSQRRAPHAKQQIAKEMESENLGAKAKVLAAENERLRCEVRAVLSNCVNQVVVGKGAACQCHVAD